MRLGAPPPNHVTKHLCFDLNVARLRKENGIQHLCFANSRRQAPLYATSRYRRGIAEVTYGTGSSPMTRFSQEFLSYEDKANVEAPAVMAQGRPFRVGVTCRMMVGRLPFQFHATHCDRLPSSTASHAHLVSEEKAVWLSEERNLHFTAKSGVIVGEFSKLRQKLEKQSPHDAGRSIVRDKQKREED
ncbi:unnamed protein product, partial [Prunus brigantina]